MPFPPLNRLIRRFFSSLPVVASALLALYPFRSEALIIYGRSNTENTTTPSASLPWEYVARTPTATAIYLGNGYFSMAAHTGTVPTSLVIDGVSYSVDASFGAVQIVTGDDDVDLTLRRLTSVPPMPPLPILIDGVDADLGQSATLVGWGRGKGDPVINGWNWGDASTVAKRWGTNTVDGGAVDQAPLTGYNFSYAGLRFYTNSNQGADEAGGAFGDSGAAMFQMDSSGIWKLSGSMSLSEDPLIFRAANALSSEVILVRLSKYAHLLRFENWKQKYLGDHTADDLGDANGDGVPFLVEYALGIDPNGPPVAGAPVIGFEDTFVTLTYTRLISAVDVNVVVEEATAVGSWSTATIASKEDLGTTDMIRTIKVKVAAGAEGQKFLRLRVEKVE